LWVGNIKIHEFQSPVMAMVALAGQAKLTKADSNVKLARVFSPKHNGIGQLLTHLEAFTRSN